MRAQTPSDIPGRDEYGDNGISLKPIAMLAVTGNDIPARLRAIVPPRMARKAQIESRRFRITRIEMNANRLIPKSTTGGNQMFV
jgi:hypothetical protein